MASTCPSCSKFCSLEMQEPENQNLDCDFPETDAFEPDPDATKEENELTEEEHAETDREGTIDYEVRIVRNSECCGEEMKEYNFGDSVCVQIAGHHGEGHDIDCDEDSLCETEESGSRYAKSYYGFELCVSLSCSCGKDVVINGADCDFSGNVLTITSQVAASEMDECN